MYIKTLYNAREEYCKEYWLNHVGYESFTERWRHFLDKWKSLVEKYIKSKDDNIMEIENLWKILQEKYYNIIL